MKNSFHYILNTNHHKIQILSIILVLTLILFKSENLNAQRIGDRLLMLDGTVLTSDSLLPVPDAHVISKFNHWGTITNNQGRFAMYVSPYDSVLFTSIGLKPAIVYIDDSVQKQIDHFKLRMEVDTILINEVIIHAFYDYRTFKQMIINMEPLSLEQFYPDWEGTELLYKQPTPMGFKGPVQALYDWLNRSARLQRKLIKNRKEYNKLMMQMGRTQDTIPAIPDYMRESLH